MTVRELNRDQMIQLKQNYIIEKNAKRNKPVFYTDLSWVDDIIDDDLMFDIYGSVEFSEDDFS